MMNRLLVLLPSIGLALTACAPGEPESIVIVNARVIDGGGGPARNVNVRVVAERIATVGDFEPSSGDTLVDADGLVLAPGFIDVHSHHDYKTGRCETRSWARTTSAMRHRKRWRRWRICY